MRRFVFVILSLLSVPLYAASTLDGNWWNRQAADTKSFYIAGFYDGSAYAVELFDALAVRLARDRGVVLSEPTAATLNETAKQSKQRLINDFSKLAVGQVAAGLNEFYRDRANSRVVLPSAIMVVVRSLGGASADEVNELVQYFRAHAYAPHQ
jgi:hypothetical protein